MSACTRTSAPDRRRLLMMGASALLAASATGAMARTRAPNIVLIFADDLGYGDLGSYGGRLIRTPALDALAADGIRLTNFYASANVCTPSRAGLLTGRYPIRSGLAHNVIMPKDTNGLPLSEVTIAEALRPAYATGFVGKWHLGHVAPFWPPSQQGFDQFFGLKYSHDMKPLALYDQPRREAEPVAEDVDFAQLTRRFIDRGLGFIDAHRDKPFFLTIALTAPHIPLHPHPDHADQSPAAAYGDVVEEVDAGVGRIVERLKAHGIDEDTLVVFTSDNGPWFEGSAAPLRDRKGGAAWDGGYKVPFIARYPRRIPAGQVSDAIAMNIDLLPTFASLAGAKLPADLKLDGRDLTQVLTRNAATPHEELILFNNEDIAALRTQRWKLVVRTYYREYDVPLSFFGAPLLFDPGNDPSESYNLASRHPEVVQSLVERLTQLQAEYEPLRLHPKKGLPGA